MRYIKRTCLAKDSIEKLILKQQNHKVVAYNGNPSKRHLIEANGLKCSYCETSPTSFEIDHFYPQNPKIQKAWANLPNYVALVNDIRNWHLVCRHCNGLKSDCLLNGLSPNYFFSIKKMCWEETSEKYIQKNFWYSGPYAKYSKKFSKYFDKLELNGQSNPQSVGFHSALLQKRVKYLKETEDLLDILELLIKNKDKVNVKNLFFILCERFKKKAQFSRMIYDNCGKRYIRVVKDIINLGISLNINQILSEL